jgi:hypothetical protein
MIFNDINHIFFAYHSRGIFHLLIKWSICQLNNIRNGGEIRLKDKINFLEVSV